jgi:hypothetical protein
VFLHHSALRLRLRVGDRARKDPYPCRDPAHLCDLDRIERHPHRSSSAAAPAAGIPGLHPQARSRRGRDHSIFPGHAHRGRRRRRPGDWQGMGSAAGDRCAARRRGQRRSGNTSRMCRSAHQGGARAARRSSPERPGAVGLAHLRPEQGVIEPALRRVDVEIGRDEIEVAGQNGLHTAVHEAFGVACQPFEPAQLVFEFGPGALARQGRDQVRTGLAGGGRWIRTSSPRREDRTNSADNPPPLLCGDRASEFARLAAGGTRFGPLGSRRERRVPCPPISRHEWILSAVRATFSIAGNQRKTRVTSP